MRFLSLLFIASVICFTAQAAPGDTTWVQAQKDVHLNYYNDFDTTVNFPDGSKKYRKVIMIFTLGKYNCGGGYDARNPGEGAGQTGWCADWDYTVQTYSMNKVGDTLELGRLITPYSNSYYSPFSWDWRHRYFFDVTDYYPALKDSNKIRVHYSGYSGGFTADIKFAFIEGTPERDVTGVKRVWDGSFTYGKASNPIETHTALTSFTAPAGTETANFKFNITGHGSDDDGCAEFCERYYKLIKDGSLVKQQTIWRDNCGSNQIYPQSGTWIYNRGNWCPGASVKTNIHQIPGVSAGSNFNLNMEFEGHTSTGGGASYTIFGSLITYGKFNKTLDASIEDIIAPTNSENYYRENPRIGLTTIKVRNTGKTVINNIEFEYGVTGQPMSKTFWTGDIAPLSDTIIDLPNSASLFAATTGVNVPYEVNITKVNRATDEDNTNNKFTTTFTPAVEWPNVITVSLLTNNSTSGGYSETEWKITDGLGAIIAQRKNNNAATNYRDTVTMPVGNYKLSVTDAGCDGLSFFASTGAGTGSIIVRKGVIALPTPGNFGGNFGCGFDQYFRVGKPTSIENVNAVFETNLNVYPNPAQDLIVVAIEGVGTVKGTLNITDNIGRVVATQIVSNLSTSINTSELTSGIYFINFIPAEEGLKKMTRKLVIIK